VRNIILIEPIHEKILDINQDFNIKPLELSKIYDEGDSNDLDKLINNIIGYRNVLNDKSKKLIVDLTPFTSISLEGRLKNFFNKLKNFDFLNDLNLIFIIKEMNKEKFDKSDPNNIFPKFYCNENLKITQLDSKNQGKFLSEFTYFNIGESFKEVHDKYVEDKLKIYLNNDYIIRKPLEEGKEYFLLPGGMIANKWIDIKSLLYNFEVRKFIAFQIAYSLTKGFKEDNIEEAGFIVSNNTSLILASFLSQIFDKDIFIIDHLGPIPDILERKIINFDTQYKDDNKLNKKKFILIEELIATGHEVDLTNLFVYIKGGVISKVITPFNLKISCPITIKNDNIISLCFPSKDIGYERLAHYSKPENLISYELLKGDDVVYED